MKPTVSDELRIVVPGPPVAWQRPRQSRTGKWFTPKATLEAEDAIAWLARAGRTRFGDRPVELECTFSPAGTLIVVRASAYASGLAGDVDNYAKTVLDALQKSEAIDNDKQVVELRLRKT